MNHPDALAEAIKWAERMVRNGDCAEHLPTLIAAARLAMGTAPDRADLIAKIDSALKLWRGRDCEARRRLAIGGLLADCRTALSADTGPKEAESGNYVADKEIEPTEVWFANGRHVKIVDGHLVIDWDRHGS